jgi:predicted aldo/keto reductase-like oxidoreductase
MDLLMVAPTAGSSRIGLGTSLKTGLFCRDEIRKTNMEKIRLGKTNLMASRIGFGGIPIQRVSEEEAVAVVRHCLDVGINFFDTATNYTTSEERIGKAIKGYPREDILIATKSHSRPPQDLEKDLMQSLRRMDIDYIDLYQFHDVRDGEDTEQILKPGGTLEAVLKAKEKGLIRHIGVCAHRLHAAIALAKTGKFETMQFPFNYITDEAKDELIPLCKEMDIGFIIMKPLSGGILPNVTLAFKFLLQFPDILPIPGIQSIAEIDEIVAISKESKLTAEEEEEIQRLRKELDKLFCRRCDYCQPCAADINISDVMYSNSLWNRQPLQKIFTGRFSAQMEKVNECIDCGVCEERCPFDLPIREIMARNYDLYLEKKKYWEERRS